MITLILVATVNATNTLEEIYFKGSLDQIEKETLVRVGIANCEVDEFSKIKDFDVSIKIRYNGAYLNQEQDMVIVAEETEDEITNRITKSATQIASRRASEIDHTTRYGTQPQEEESENFFNYIKATYDEEKCILIKTDIAELLKPQSTKGPKNNSQSNIFQEINGSEVIVITSQKNSSVDLIEKQNNSFFTEREFVPGSIVVQNWEAVGMIDNDGRRVIGKESIDQIINQNQIKNTQRDQDIKIKEAFVEIGNDIDKPEQILAKVSQGVFDHNNEIKEEIIKKFKKEDNMPLLIGGILFFVLVLIIAIVIKGKKRK